MMFKLEIDKTSMNRARRALAGFKDGFPKAFKRTLDKTSAGARTEMVDLMSARYRHKTTKVRERITVYKCPSYKFLNSSVRSTGPGIHLTDIGGFRQTAKGITIDIKKATGRKLIRHAFIAPGKASGKRIAFIRETVGGQMVPRDPISALYASEPEIIYNTPENWRVLEGKIQARFDKNFSHEVEVVLKGIA